MVWYHKFEYAVAHWLQKSTEHVLGCVLCSPGCFSLFRGSALMDDNIMRRYTIRPTEASHHLMYDQGEDRWLCTLLLQQGYRVDYAAASDAYTYAPEGYAEFFNQRRRWMPSTIANIMDLLAAAKNTVSINKNISWLYMFYQGALMASTLIGPATVIMMIAGAYVAVFRLNLVTSHAIALTRAVLYTILCFFVKPKNQILVAEIFSAMYAFIMMVVFVGCIITAVKESPFHPSVIFVCSIVFIFLFAALIHPWEFSCIIHGALYFLCVPSGFLLLVIYSLVNMNVVSWGTREVPNKKTKAEKEEEERKKKEKEENKKQGFFGRFMPKLQLQDLKGMMEITKKEDKSILLLERMNQNIERLLRSKDGVGNNDHLTQIVVENGQSVESDKTKKRVSFATVTIGGDESERTDEEEYIYQKEKKKRNDLINQKWLELKEFQSGSVLQMDEEETHFWETFIKKYLEPLDTREEEKRKVTKELAELRNNVTAGFAFINLIWIAINFMFQLRRQAVITFPLRQGADDVSEENIKIDVLGLMFIIFFVVILFIQFVGMIIHRWGTFMHLIAITEIPNPCKKNMKYQTSIINGELNADNLIRVCDEISSEPLEDYPSDEEDECKKEEVRERVLKDKIINFATQGVAENLRESQRNPNIGVSLRDTRKFGESRTTLRSTITNDNVRREVKNILARTQRKFQVDDQNDFKPNVLRQRGNRTKTEEQARTPKEHRRFGFSEPLFSDVMNEINNSPNLQNKVKGITRNFTGTFRPDPTDDGNEEPIYHEIKGAETMRIDFQKKLQKLSKKGLKPSRENGCLQFDQFEMHPRRDSTKPKAYF